MRGDGEKSITTGLFKVKKKERYVSERSDLVIWIWMPVIHVSELPIGTEAGLGDHTQHHP